ncbi:MAG: queuosine precursor transporter [Dehalococcoidales bacterium]|nr:queuosine precursor transporter [Dehalococcoidales bacterium]
MNVSQRMVVITALFVTCLLTANIVGVKMFSIGPVILPAAVAIFPFSYIFGDVLTEVYGYRWARKVIWLGFLCNLIFVVFAQVGQHLPPAPGWGWQSAYETILGFAPRLLAASFCGYLAGEFSNSFIMSKMKILTKGRWLWSRTISSTIIGEGLDTIIFVTGAYYGTPFFVPVIILYHWLTKTAIEAVFTPVTYAAVNYLKNKESLDTFDYKTNFNPFRVLD